MASKRTAVWIVHIVVIASGVAAGVFFTLLAGLLYGPNDIVGTLAIGVGTVTGAAAGVVWSRAMIAIRRRHSGSTCIGVGMALGTALGMASALLVHVAYGLGGLRWPGQTFDLGGPPSTFGEWCAYAAFGQLFGIGVGAIAGLLCGVVLLIAVRKDEPSAPT